MKLLLLFGALCLSYTHGFVDRRPYGNRGNPLHIFPNFPPINPTFPKNGGQWPDAYKRYARSVNGEQTFVPEAVGLQAVPEMIPPTHDLSLPFKKSIIQKKLQTESRSSHSDFIPTPGQ